MNDQLRLRTVRHYADLADEIAHLLWDALAQSRWDRKLDPHRFPDLARVFNKVLIRHIDDCEACPTIERCDPWARTGGGAPTPTERPPVCDEYASRLMKEAGDALQQLLLDLEKQTYRFLSRNNPARAAFTPDLSQKIHRLLQTVVALHLIQNIASSCCDECTRSLKRGVDHDTRQLDPGPDQLFGRFEARLAKGG